MKNLTLLLPLLCLATTYSAHAGATEVEFAGVGGNEKIGKYEFGKDFPKLTLKQNAKGQCSMSTAKIQAINLKGQLNGSKTFSFDCESSFDDASNGGYSPITDAYFFGGQTYDMYESWYKIKPLVSKIVMRAHYGVDYDNAFWNGSSISIGDGNDEFYPMASADLIAHEISHGFTEQHSNLEYEGQSGGINESFSDFSGKALENFIYGKNNWSFGEDITKGEGAFRYMDDPSKDKTSIDDARKMSDKTEVHSSSGVFNKAFYLIATSQGWNIKKTFEVFLHANRNYWSPKSDFSDAASGAIHSAKDLEYEVDTLITAFKQVGIKCSDDSCSIMSGKKPKKKLAF